jgi:hypothetical protein
MAYPDDFNDPSNLNSNTNSDPSNPYDIINRYRRAMADANNNSASGTWFPAQTNQQNAQQDQLDAQNQQNFQNFQNGLAKSAQTQQAPPTQPRTPYSPGSNNYPSNSIQTSQFGTGLMDTLARIRRGQYLSQQQQQPAQSPQSFQMQGVTYPQFNQNQQPGTQPATQSGATGQLPQSGQQPQQNFQTPDGRLDTTALLRYLNVQQPDIRQSPFMSNQFMTNHPTLGGVLNNAMFAAAGTQTAQGPSGAGTGISNVLRGVGGVPAAQRQFQMDQQLAPLQYAEGMAKLYGTVATAQESLGKASWYNARPGVALENAQIKALQTGIKPEQFQYDNTGKYLGYVDNSGRFQAVDPNSPQANAVRPNPNRNSASPDSLDGRIGELRGQGWSAAQATAQAVRERDDPANASRNNAPGGSLDDQRNRDLSAAYVRENNENEKAQSAYQAAISPKIPGARTDPQIEANARAARDAWIKRNADFRKQSVDGINQRGKPNAAPKAPRAGTSDGFKPAGGDPATHPQRPAGTPSNYVWGTNGAGQAGYGPPS